MRRKRILCAVGLAVCLLAGCGRQQGQMKYIGIEEAKRLALEDAGMPAAEVEFTTADLTSRSGQDYYQVDFTAAGAQYKYDIDALTGVVIQAVTPEDSQDSEKSDAVLPASSTELTDNTATGQDAAGTVITDKEAKAKALEHAGLSDTEVNFVKSELEYEDGRKVYDVEFYTSDHKEYDYEIDACTGEVIRYDYDMESSMPPAGNSKTITAKKARELVLAQVPGASENDIWEFEEDYEDGRMVYEGKVIYNGMEYEFEIDAYSGSFRSWEVEPVND